MSTNLQLRAAALGALITAALGGLSLLTPSGADAASRTIRFDAYRPLDGDRFVNVLFTYDDAVPSTYPPSPPLRRHLQAAPMGRHALRRLLLLSLQGIAISTTLAMY